jgi:hypothetical protein
MGGSLKSYISFLQNKYFTLNLGFWAILFYGDEDIVSDVKPLGSYTFHVDDIFSFTMGYIDNISRHYMLDALQSEQLEYTRQVEYGFQILFKNTYIYHDAWVNWNLLNTPEHREYFDAGGNLDIYLYNFILNAQGYWSHHGGELFRDGPVQNSLSVALGLENFYLFKNKIFHRFGLKLYYLTDKEDFLGAEGADSTGYGVLSELYLQVLTFTCYLDYWKGDNFITEEGNPLYRNNQWIFWGVRNETNIFEISDFIFEFRMHHFRDNDEFSYQYRFGLKTALDFGVNYFSRK